MARESPHISLSGKGTLCPERTPPGDPRSSSFTLDTGDFMGGTLGGGDLVNIRSGGAQIRGGSASGVDGQLLHMEGYHRVKESFPLPPLTDSAYDHSKGNCLFNQADPTRD